jgi:tetratricopeptide (TPR) repeat protein
MKHLTVFILGLFIAISVHAQSKWGKTPEDSVSCVENTSLYVEFYKQKNYKDAKRPWKKAIEVCPKSSKNLYIKGAKMYKTAIVQEKNKAERALLVDTLMWIYDIRIENFGQKGYVLGRKGADLLKYEKSSYEEAYNILKEAYALQGDNSEKGAVTSYYQAAEYMYQNGKKSQADLLELFPQLAETMEVNISKAKDDETRSKWINALGVMEQLFSVHATCENLVEIYRPKYEANKDDTSNLKQIIAFFSKKDCTDDDLYLEASMSLDKVKPSGISKFGIGRSLLKRDRYAEAVKYFKEGAEIAVVPEAKAKNLEYAATTYLAMKQYPSVKTYALKLLKEEPNNATAYKLLGDAYLYGSSSVGDNECMQGCGYWAAISKYLKAQSLDPELTDETNKKIARARSLFPKKEDCFFYSISDGQTVNCGGWINEDVTVKTN